MNWKEHLAKLEHDKQWDTAIEYMQKVVTENPNNLDAYLSINYLLMNLLVEEDYDNTKHDYYASLTKKYFDESYAKFSDNPEYLFYIAEMAYMSEWYFDITLEEADKMFDKAMRLDPNNMLYKWLYYVNLDRKNPKNIKPLVHYAQLALEQNSPIQKMLLNKGSLGKCLLDMLIHWSQCILLAYPHTI
jgi:tetratricopeptide (TPR) repeat protein